MHTAAARPARRDSAPAMLRGVVAVARTGFEAVKSAARWGTSTVALRVTAAAAKALHAPAATPLHVDATVAAPKLPTRLPSVPVREERLPSSTSRTTVSDDSLVRNAAAPDPCEACPHRARVAAR